MWQRVISPCGSRRGIETRKSHEPTRKHCMARDRDNLANRDFKPQYRQNGVSREASCSRGLKPFALPGVTRSRTLLLFREISCGFRVSPRCRDPKDETLRLRSAKVGASMSRPTKAKLKANCADLQAGPQAQRFSREATRQRDEFLCVGRRPGVRCLRRAKYLEEPNYRQASNRSAGMT